MPMNQHSSHRNIILHQPCRLMTALCPGNPLPHACAARTERPLSPHAAPAHSSPPPPATCRARSMGAGTRIWINRCWFEHFSSQHRCNEAAHCVARCHIRVGSVQSNPKHGFQEICLHSGALLVCVASGFWVQGHERFPGATSTRSHHPLGTDAPLPVLHQPPAQRS